MTVACSHLPMKDGEKNFQTIKAAANPLIAALFENRRFSDAVYNNYIEVFKNNLKTDATDAEKKYFTLRAIVTINRVINRFKTNQFSNKEAALDYFSHHLLYDLNHSEPEYNNLLVRILETIANLSSLPFFLKVNQEIGKLSLLIFLCAGLLKVVLLLGAVLPCTPALVTTVFLTSAVSLLLSLTVIKMVISLGKNYRVDQLSTYIICPDSEFAVLEKGAVHDKNLKFYVDLSIFTLSGRGGPHRAANGEDTTFDF